MRFARFQFFLLLLTFLVLMPLGNAEAVADTVEGITFHPFTMDANNNTCVAWDVPNETTANCDPINLLFNDQSVSEVSAMLQSHSWGTGGFGSTQWLHYSDETLHSQDVQLYLNESSTLRYHIRLWQVPGEPSKTLGAVHHESGLFVHTIDKSWEDSEKFVKDQLCPAEMSCESSPLLDWQMNIQDQDPDGSPDTWRDWDNDMQLTVISYPRVESPPSVTIDRVAADVVLSWPAVENAVAYHVYRDTAPYFAPGTPLAVVSSTVYTDTAIVNSGLNHYYAVTAADALSRESSPSNGVGLFFATVSTGWNLLSWPILPADTRLDAVLGDQLYGTDDPQTADRVLVWEGDTQSYESAWYCGGAVCESWGEPWANHWLAGDYAQSQLTLEPDTGFWVQNRSGVNETLVLVGHVAESNRSVAVGQHWQMLGSAFPTSKALDDANLLATGSDSPATADRVLSWDAESQSYKSAWYCGGAICEGWGEPWANHWLAGDYAPTDIVLAPGSGFWYQNRHDSFIWTHSWNN